MPRYLRKIEFRVDVDIEVIDYTFSAYSISDKRGPYCDIESDGQLVIGGEIDAVDYELDLNLMPEITATTSEPGDFKITYVRFATQLLRTKTFENLCAQVRRLAHLTAAATSGGRHRQG